MTSPSIETMSAKTSFVGTRRGALKFAPVLIGLFAFVTLGGLYVSDHGLYLAILRAVGMKPQNLAFIDSQFIYAAKKCWDLGYDVYMAVPCYPIPGKYSYSPLWLRMTFLPGDNDTSRISIGLLTNIAFILSIATLPSAQSWREAALMTMALISTAVIFALERNNVDVWMFLLVVAGGHLLTKTDHRRWAGYGLFLLAGLLKYYPITLLILALKEKPKQLVAVTATASGTCIIFLLCYYSEIATSLANIPYTNFLRDMVGISNIPNAIAAIFSAYTTGRSTTLTSIATPLRLALTGLLVFFAIRLSRRPGFISAWRQLSTPDQIWLVIGCTVTLGCYIMVQNVSYRLIYLLIVLSGLLAFRRTSTDTGTTKFITVAAVLIVPTMWMEGIRHWAEIAIQRFHIASSEGYLIVFVAWLFRELIWLFLATIMLAVVAEFMTHSPSIQGPARKFFRKTA